MTAHLSRPMTPPFEEKVFQRLEALGLSLPELAERLGLAESELRQLCHQGDPSLSQFEQLAHHLRVPLAYFQHSAFNVVGFGNTQKIKIDKAAAHELAAQLGVCRIAVEQSQQLLAAKDEIIACYESPPNASPPTSSLPGCLRQDFRRRQLIFFYAYASLF